MINTVEDLLQQANAGDAAAQYELAMRIKRGENTGGLMQERRIEALGWLVKAAQNDNIDAAYEAGVSYLFGEGTNKSPEKAKEYLTKAAQKNHPGAQYELGEMAFNKKDYFEAVKWLALSAKADNWDAIKRLAECYKFGFGIIRDEIKAKNLLLRAEELYAAEKKRREKVGYLTDLEIKEYDLTEKYKRDKSSESIHDLARFYLNNEKYIDAKEWAETGYVRGDGVCTIILAQIHEKGLNVKKNIKLAHKFYQKAISLKCAEAAQILAQKHLSGEPGFPKSKGKAIKYITLAHTFGDPSALPMLSRINPKLSEKVAKKYPY